jgi:membrane-associated phospholipid phosphatase
MAAHEWIAAAYFAAFALIAWMLPVRAGKRLVATGVALGVLLVTTVLSATFSPAVRAWIPHLYLVGGYWLPALLVRSSPSWFEQWLDVSDARLRRVLPGVRGYLAHLVELAYLLCYLLIPISFAVVWASGGPRDIERFWIAVLVAGFACYATLPWLVSRPPRLRVQQADRTGLAAANAFVLGRVSHQFNTFPSGHVAVATAAAAGVLAVSVRAGVIVSAVAAAISVGAVAGRYHYVVDVLIALLVAAAAIVVARAV